MPPAAEAQRAAGDPDAITLSQNEIESLCMKAARGAGFPWGLAEEAGHAAGWLAARGIDGTEPLLRLLLNRSHWPGAAGKPDIKSDHWQSTGDTPLCPIVTGAALIDRALLSDGPFSRDTRLDPVEGPVLILPFLARAARIRGKAVVVELQGTNLVVGPSGSFDQPLMPGFLGEAALSMTIRVAVHFQGGWVADPCLPVVSRTVLAALDGFALKTTVPATDISRRGAGSASADDD